MKQKIGVVLIVCIVAQLLQIIYAQRAYFTESYDHEYWKDRFEHSQYQLPLTKRLIGDDGVYGYAGYRVIHGADPFSIVVDKPPFGKYIIGLSIALWNNPNVISLLLGIGTLILLYIVSNIVLKDVLGSLLVTALFSVDAMFYSQLWISAMDISQLFFLLLSILLVLSGSPLLSGVALGLFTEIKPPILLVIIIPIVFFWMKNIQRIARWGIGFAIGVLVPYAWYVHLGHSLLDIARVHKFMLTLIRSSTLPVHGTAMIETLFLGRFPQISSGMPIAVSEWWPVWPVIVILSVFAWLRKKDAHMTGLLSMTFLSLIVLSSIPSYPRYLFVILPFLYLFSVFVLMKAHRLLSITIIVLTLIAGLVRTSWYMRPTPDGLLSVCMYSYAHQFFADVYEECLDSESKKGMSRSEFRVLSQQALEDAEILHIEVKKRKQDTFDVTYTTSHLGTFTETKTIPLVKEKGQWKIHWNWNMLINGFLPGHTVVTTIVPGYRGSVFAGNGKVIIKDTMGSLVSLDPSRMDTKREEEMLNLFSSISSVSPLGLQNAYLENPLPGKPVALFTLFEPLSDRFFREYPGVTTTPYHTRVYYGQIGSGDIKNTIYTECCTRIYSSFNYHGITGPDYMYEHLLSGYDGGSLRIMNEKGETVRTIIKKVPKNGQDVVLQFP